jgi:hypothetical protein
LSGAVRAAVRSGDEAGVAGPNVALALLGNAGPDEVRPFIARLRAALSDSGWDALDVLAATASTPNESVDPEELRRLATERLLQIGAERFEPAEPSLEFELRQLPGVVSVGVEGSGIGQRISVAVLDPADTLREEVHQLVLRHRPDAAVHVLAAVPPKRSAAGSSRSGQVIRNRYSAVHAYGVATNGQPRDAVPATRPARGTMETWAAVENDPVPLLSATAPGSADPEERGSDSPRVVLLSATFDADRGVSEVSLALGGARGTGRVPAGPLAGGAQATLVALGALGRDVPFYLVSAERARGTADEPVVVVLAPRRSGDAVPSGAGERIGVAAGTDDVEAASRSALSALNRYLAGSDTTA